MKAKIYWKRLFLIGAAFVFIFWGLYNLSFLQSVLGRMIEISFPFIFGFALAFIVNLPMKYIEGKLIDLNKGKESKWFRLIAILLSFLFISLLMYFLIVLVLPDIQDTLTYFVNAVPSFVNNAIDSGFEFIERNPQLVESVQQLGIDWNSVQSDSINFLRDIFTSLIGSIINYVPAIFYYIFDFVVALIFAIYLLFSKETLIMQTKKLMYGLFDIQWGNFFVNFGSAANEIFSGFVGGQVMAGVLTGIALYLLMILFNFPYALSISVITAITTLIPFYGAIFGGVIGFLLISVIDFPKAVWFIVLIIVVQQVEGNILYPNVVGNSIGIPGIWVMVTVTLGGALFGLTGMFLSVPIFSLFYRLMSHNINHRLNEENLAVDYDTRDIPSRK